MIVLVRKIGRLSDLRWQLLARSVPYAVAFTPTAYHYPPNTIVAPLHLSTICGNLFYANDYTAGMFVYRVVVAVACGWALISIAHVAQTYEPGVGQRPNPSIGRR